MHFDYKKIRIGLRTIKTAAAVLISITIVAFYGMSASKMIFAMLGAMAAMEHSFKESVESCLTQVVGMVLGALIGQILLFLSLPSLLDIGVGIVVVITFYNVFRIRYSPTLPCLIVVTMCTHNNPDTIPLFYAVGRLWDTAIGLMVGMVINTLIFPYDNSNKIRAAIESLDKEVIIFLEEMYNGDSILPDTDKMVRMINDMGVQLQIFSKQSVLLHKENKRNQLKAFQVCAGKERQLLAQMEVLCRMGKPGKLTEENRKRLKECSSQIKIERKGKKEGDAEFLEEATPISQTVIPDLQREIKSLEERIYMTEKDLVTNYHVTQILILREEMMNALKTEAAKSENRREYLASENPD